MYHFVCTIIKDLSNLQMGRQSWANKYSNDMHWNKIKVTEVSKRYNSGYNGMCIVHVEIRNENLCIGRKVERIEVN